MILYYREDSIAVLWRCVVFTALSDLIGLFHPWTSWQVQAFSQWLHAQSFVSVCRQEIPVCMWLLVIITCPSLGCCSVLSVLSMKRTRSVHEPHCDSVPFAYGQLLGRGIPIQEILLHTVCSTVPPNAYAFKNSLKVMAYRWFITLPSHLHYFFKTLLIYEVI